MAQSVGIRDLVQRWMAWKTSIDGAEYQYKMLAAAAGVSPSYLSNIMTGARNAGVKTITGIARAFGVGLAEFYAGPPENGVRHDPEGDMHASSPTDDGDDGADRYGLALSREPAREIDKLFASLGVRADDLFTDMTPAPPGAALPDKSSLDSGGNGRSADTSTDGRGIPLLDRLPEESPPAWPPADGAGTLPRDFGLGGRRVFAVRVPDASMMPDLRRGDMLIADIDANFAPSEGVIGIVMLEGRFMPRRIIAREHDHLALPSNPAFLSTTIPRDARIYKIVLWLPAMTGKF